MKKSKIEILAPAGDYSALVGAIYGGCDAIYFGTDIFNARIRATNFSLNEAQKAIALAHAHSKKVYITLNTQLFDKELGTMLEYVSKLHNMGADALIVADFGVASLIKKHYPQIELHISTQASVHNLDGANFLAKALGATRVVLARELDKNNIEFISKNCDCETEIFIHGAHCMSVSGQCLMSYAMGGRSGNRGECAQPCRLPYVINSSSAFFLSLKDMSLANHISEILNSGVTSLKIEGRMKNEEYVSGVTKIYRRLIDEKRNAKNEEIKTLGGLFSRQGFTDGYFQASINKGMLGIRTDKDKERSRELEGKPIELERPMVDMQAELILGKKSRLTVSLGEKKVCVEGDTIEEAINAPISKDDVVRCLSKLGSTPFKLGKIDVSMSENIILRISSLNALRRSAIEKLFEVEEKAEVAEYDPPSLPIPEKIKTAVFLDAGQIPKNSDYFDVVFLPLDNYDSLANGVMMPPVIFDSEWDEVEKKLKDARGRGAEWALVSNIGQIKRVKSLGFKMLFDYRFNAFNRPCVEFLMKQGAKNIILSPELTLAQARDFSAYSLVAYGKLPLMTTHKCVLKDTVGCDKCKGYITDRQGARLFVIGISHHRNVIFNSVPTYMADKLSDLKNHSLHFIFSDETQNEAYETIKAYKEGKAPNGSFRRIK